VLRWLEDGTEEKEEGGGGVFGL
jgi:hypothetical protein